MNLFFTFISLYFISFASFATINTEALRDYSIDPGLHSSLSQAMELDIGNSKKWEIEFGVNLKYLDKTLRDSLLPKQEVLFTLSYNTGEKNSEKNILNGFSHLRWTKYINPNIAFEIFAQHEFDNFVNLEKRQLIGSGIRIPFIYSKSESFFIGTSIMYEYEILNNEDLSFNKYRLNVYISYLHRFESRAIFNTGLYFQPELTHFSDYRINMQNALTFPLNQNLNFTFSNHIEYDHLPPNGVESFDLSFKNEISYHF